MKKTIFLLIIIVAGYSIIAKAQTANSTPAADAALSASAQSIHWMSIQEAEKQNKKHPKKILIDTYTDWCGWCKRLDATTWQDSKIIAYMNENYYAVKFNAESKDSIKFDGKVYHYNPPANQNGNGINELTYTLLKGSQIAYPTIVVLDEKLNRVGLNPGYLPSDGMNNWIHYFGDNYYKSVEWTAFNADPSKYLKN